MRILWRSITRRLRRDRAGLSSLIFLVVLTTVALLAPWLAPFDPLDVDFEHVRQPPDAQHWLGTDKQGRDVLSRLLFGARLSLAVGFVSQAPILLIGVSAGCLAGYRGGRSAGLIMRVVDVFYAFPTTLLLIALMAILGRGFGSLLIALTITSWAGVARLVRGQVLRLKQAEFITAAVSLGAADWHILWRHILPNLSGIILVMLSLGIPGAIVAEAGLSFLGIGLLPPAPSWGLMLSDGFSVVRSSPHLAWAPAIAIGLTMLALYTLGDSLADALDPRAN
ncbi:ABC transporter permease [Candidatus Amarolinea dominans]|uniref:ABC transporter permease n=1 Tax=Candidatus Amarolinea dominans TaxID=3140696 RepID=UPI001D1E80C5|nr:ABC transporter permease [Anaerolineae bacterium]